MYTVIYRHPRNMARKLGLGDVNVPPMPGEVIKSQLPQVKGPFDIGPMPNEIPKTSLPGVSVPVPDVPGVNRTYPDPFTNVIQTPPPPTRPPTQFTTTVPPPQSPPPPFAGFDANDLSAYFGLSVPQATALLYVVSGATPTQEQAATLKTVNPARFKEGAGGPDWGYGDIQWGLQHLAQHPKGSHYQGGFASFINNFFSSPFDTLAAIFMPITLVTSKVTDAVLPTSIAPYASSIITPDVSIAKTATSMVAPSLLPSTSAPAAITDAAPTAAADQTTSFPPPLPTPVPTPIVPMVLPQSSGASWNVTSTDSQVPVSPEQEAAQAKQDDMIKGLLVVSVLGAAAFLGSK